MIPNWSTKTSLRNFVESAPRKLQIHSVLPRARLRVNPYSPIMFWMTASVLFMLASNPSFVVLTTGMAMSSTQTTGWSETPKMSLHWWKSALALRTSEIRLISTDTSALKNKSASWPCTSVLFHANSSHGKPCVPVSVLKRSCKQGVGFFNAKELGWVNEIS